MLHYDPQHVSSILMMSSVLLETCWGS